MNIEVHITVDTKHAEKATEVARSLKWKTSEIARDPVLGDKNFFYLTCHFADAQRAFVEMERATRHLEMFDIPILRQKVEAIIFDTKGRLTKEENYARSYA